MLRTRVALYRTRITLHPPTNTKNGLVPLKTRDPPSGCFDNFPNKVLNVLPKFSFFHFVSDLCLKICENKVGLSRTEEIKSNKKLAQISFLCVRIHTDS